MILAPCAGSLLMAASIHCNHRNCANRKPDNRIEAQSDHQPPDIRFKDGSRPAAALQLRAVRNAKRGLVLPVVLSACALWSAAPTQRVAPVSRQEFTRRLVAAAIERTHHSVR
jgi:hypothetical protein